MIFRRRKKVVDENTADSSAVSSADSSQEDALQNVLPGRPAGWAQSDFSPLFSQLANEHTLIDAISQAMREGLLLLDNDGAIIAVNHSARSILGIDNDYARKNIFDFIRDSDLIEHIESAQRGEDSETTITIAGRIYRVTFNETVSGLLILFLNITERVNAERQRREFSANVSHELKTPLTTISGYAELIENGLVKTEDIPGAAAKIHSEAGRLIELIQDIMRVSELDESSQGIERTQVDLVAIAQKAVESLRSRAHEAQVSLRLDRAQARVLVVANRQMMSELFDNLLTNAIKYNRPGGSVVVWISPRASARAGFVTISIADTGIGIADEDIDRIFERFYRVEKSRSKAIEGTGLGLSIVKHIVADHGGTIEVHSKLGGGTRFDVSLPAQVAQDEHSQGQAS